MLTVKVILFPCCQKESIQRVVLRTRNKSNQLCYLASIWQLKDERVFITWFCFRKNHSVLQNSKNTLKHLLHGFLGGLFTCKENSLDWMPSMYKHRKGMFLETVMPICEAPNTTTLCQKDTMQTRNTCRCMPGRHTLPVPMSDHWAPTANSQGELRRTPWASKAFLPKVCFHCEPLRVRLTSCFTSLVQCLVQHQHI